MSHWSRWLGNENLANGTKVFLLYEQFKVASAKDKYKLTVGGFQGTTTDPMAGHNGMNFTAKNSDNDQWIYGNCAEVKLLGGWWFNSCWHAAPNSIYQRKSGFYINNQWVTFVFIEIKIRPFQCII